MRPLPNDCLNTYTRISTHERTSRQFTVVSDKPTYRYRPVCGSVMSLGDEWLDGLRNDGEPHQKRSSVAMAHLTATHSDLSTVSANQVLADPSPQTCSAYALCREEGFEETFLLAFCSSQKCHIVHERT